LVVLRIAAPAVNYRPPSLVFSYVIHPAFTIVIPQCSVVLSGELYMDVAV
jgi:hypothetical protein